VWLLNNGTDVQMGFIFEILQINFHPFQRIPFPHLYQINFHPFQRIPFPHLYTTAYEFLFVQSNAAGHHVTPCSVVPPFSISSHRQIKYEFTSTHISVRGTGKSHREVNPVDVHCVDAESMISSSTILTFSSSLAF
jgi:hypothetical protein